MNSNKHIIKFRRTKSETYNLFFSKRYKLKLLGWIILYLLFIPAIYFFSFLFFASWSVLLDFEFSNLTLILFITPLALLLIFTSVKSIFGEAYAVRQYVKKVYKSRDYIDITYEIDEEKFTYETSDCSFSCHWNNLNNFSVKKQYVTMQTILPMITFIIPKEATTAEAIGFIELKIIRKK
ncbi:MAG: hypothetical protein EA362_10630 [Saprospirales bacterium]|nr:MAG: hypothetical protein EA362_10630 [Saprospirales bacterium]